MPNYTLSGTWPNVKGSSLIKPPPTDGTQDRSMTRRILRESWNGNQGYYKDKANSNGYKVMSNGFRAVMNAGDPLGRKNYSCGGPDMVSGSATRTIRSSSKSGGQSARNCDTSEIQPQTCNVKYVYDSSDFIKYKKQRATNRGYSYYSKKPSINMGFDYSYGGANNTAQSAIRRVRK